MGEQRRTVIIKNAFQQRVILQTVVTTFIVLNFVITLGFLLTDTGAVPGYSRTSLALTIAALELFALGATYYLSRRVSFHIAGPVYAIERSLKHFGEGDLTLHVTLRKGDYFLEVSDVVNQTIDNFHRHIEQAQQAAAQLQSEIGEDEKNGPLVKQLIEELGYFTTSENPLRPTPPDKR